MGSRRLAGVAATALIVSTVVGRAYAQESSAGGARSVAETALDLKGRGIEDRAPIRSKEENEGEFLAYCDALVTASQADLATGARRDLTFAHLYEQPGVYRGEVVHVEGSLARLRRFEAPSYVWSQGVRELYEGWVFDARTYGANAMAIVFTELPGGLELAERMDRRVAFDGYFFKRYRYAAGDGRRDAPLLIGRRPILLDDRPAAAQGRGVSKAMLWSSGVILGTLAAALCGLAWWFRRGDRRVRECLQRKRSEWEKRANGDADRAARTVTAPPTEAE